MKNRKILIISIVAVLLAVAAIGTVYAILKGRSGTVTNTLKADSDLDPSVTETFENNVKSAVKVKIGETGYSVYVRAAVVVNWQDTAGDIYPLAPVEGTDYSISMNSTNGWFEIGGFWYHKNMVISGDETSVLIDSCTQITAAPEGYQLHVEILSQTVQAAGWTDDGSKHAVEDAWQVVTVGTDGVLSQLSSTHDASSKDAIVTPDW